MTDASVLATLRASSTALRNAGDMPSSVSLSLLPALLQQLDTQIARLARDHHRMRRPPDQHLQVRRRERLGQIVPGPGAQRFDARGHARDCRS